MILPAIVLIICPYIKRGNEIVWQEKTQGVPKKATSGPG
jgi:hypothetical protein